MDEWSFGMKFPIVSMTKWKSLCLTNVLAINDSMVSVQGNLESHFIKKR